MSKNIEYFSKDILDEEFINTFKFRYYFQLLIASSRVNVRDRFVTPPSFFQRCFTLFIIAVVLILDYIIIHRYNLLIGDNIALYYLSMCVIGLQTVTFLSNIIHLRFCNGEENAEFYVKQQQLQKLMKLSQNKKVSKMLRTTNAVSLIIVLVIFAALVSAASSKGSASFLSLLGTIYLQTSFITEIATCSNVFSFFFIHVRFINSVVMNYIKQRNTIRQHQLSSTDWALSVVFITNKYMRQTAAATHNFISSDTDEYLKQILDGFAMFQSLFSFQVFLCCCKLVGSSLITFEYVLFSLRNDTIELIDSVIQAFFTIVDLLMVILLGVRCEIFLREVKETKRLAIAILHRHHDGPLRDKAKRMLKLIEDSPPRFSVYDMWDLDANILLQMFMLVTTVIVTQLQFVFL